jgi:integrase
MDQVVRPPLVRAKVHNGRRMPDKLTPLAIKNILRRKVPGRWGDGKNLYLVSKTGLSFWFEFVYRRDGRAHSIALGNLLDVSLPAAREKAAAHRATLRQGKLPEKVKKSAIPAPGAPTMAACIDRYRTLMLPRWSLSTQQAWRAQRIAGPSFLAKPVTEVTTADIVDALKERTAIMRARTIRKMETIFAWAIATGLRAEPNPASLKISHYFEMPKHEAEHHPAMPWRDLQEFLRELRNHEGFAPRCLEFQILCAVRPGEARRALWSEVDLDARIWVIPSGRMKARREHRVPLSPPAVDLLQKLEATRHAPQVFPAKVGGFMCADTIAKWVPAPFHAHGFRTSFTNWSADNRHDFEVTEKSLGHLFADETSRAYRRSDLLDQRRAMLEQWADFLAGKGDLLDT